MPSWSAIAFVCVSLLVVLFAPAPAAAELQTLRYVATWAGLPAGEVHLQLAEGTNGFRSQIDINTKGLPRWLTRFRARGISYGVVAADGLAAPARYDADYGLRLRKGKRISMRFVGTGNQTVAERGPEDSSETFLMPTPVLTAGVDPL